MTPQKANCEWSGMCVGGGVQGGGGGWGGGKSGATSSSRATISFQVANTHICTYIHM